jgi:hypothetical protein
LLLQKNVNKPKEMMNHFEQRTGVLKWCLWEGELIKNGGGEEEATGKANAWQG